MATLAGKDISFVVFSNVSLPVMVCSPSFPAVILVLSNLALGCSRVSKKSGLLRWFVSLSNSVFSDAVSISTATDFSVFLSASTSALPLNFSKLQVRGSGFFGAACVPTKMILVFVGERVTTPPLTAAGAPAEAAFALAAGASGAAQARSAWKQQAAAIRPTIESDPRTCRIKNLQL